MLVWIGFLVLVCIGIYLLLRDEEVSPCVQPSQSGYDFTEVVEGDLVPEDFNVTGVTCAQGWSGTATASTCSEGGSAYTVSGCERDCYLPAETILPPPVTHDSGASANLIDRIDIHAASVDPDRSNYPKMIQCSRGYKNTSEYTRSLRSDPFAIQTLTNVGEFENHVKVTCPSESSLEIDLGNGGCEECDINNGYLSDPEFSAPLPCVRSEDCNQAGKTGYMCDPATKTCGCVPGRVASGNLCLRGDGHGGVLNDGAPGGNSDVQAEMLRQNLMMENRYYLIDLADKRIRDRGTVAGVEQGDAVKCLCRHGGCLEGDSHNSIRQEIDSNTPDEDLRDTITCITPVVQTGYQSPLETNLDAPVQWGEWYNGGQGVALWRSLRTNSAPHFDVTPGCAPGYSGTPGVIPCEKDSEPYTLSGCDGTPITGMCTDNTAVAENVICPGDQRLIVDAATISGNDISTCCESAAQVITGRCSGNTSTSDNFDCSSSSPPKVLIADAANTSGATESVCCEDPCAVGRNLNEGDACNGDNICLNNVCSEPDISSWHIAALNQNCTDACQGEGLKCVSDGDDGFPWGLNGFQEIPFENQGCAYSPTTVDRWGEAHDGVPQVSTHDGGTLFPVKDSHNDCWFRGPRDNNAHELDVLLANVANPSATNGLTFCDMRPPSQFHPKGRNVRAANRPPRRFCKCIPT